MDVDVYRSTGKDEWVRNEWALGWRLIEENGRMKGIERWGQKDYGDFVLIFLQWLT